MQWQLSSEREASRQGFVIRVLFCLWCHKRRAEIDIVAQHPVSRRHLSKKTSAMVRQFLSAVVIKSSGYAEDFWLPHSSLIPAQ